MLKRTQCTRLPADLSFTNTTRLWVPAGGSPHSRGGEISSPLQVYKTGMVSSIPKAGLLNSKIVGSNVAVGSDTAVEGAVDVGGNGVSAGGMGVAVGGNGVSVGGMGVAAGGNDVSVGSRRVAVGGSGVSDGSDAPIDGIGITMGCAVVDVQPDTPRVMSKIGRNSAKSVLISPSLSVDSCALQRS